MEEREQIKQFLNNLDDGNAKAAKADLKDIMSTKVDVLNQRAVQEVDLLNKVEADSKVEPEVVPDTDSK